MSGGKGAAALGCGWGSQWKWTIMDLSSKMAGSFCRLVCNQFRLVCSYSRALLPTKSFVQSGGQNYFIETNRGSFQLLQRILVAPSCNQRDLLANFCRTWPLVKVTKSYRYIHGDESIVDSEPKMITNLYWLIHLLIQFTTPCFRWQLVSNQGTIQMTMKPTSTFRPTKIQQTSRIWRISGAN